MIQRILFLLLKPGDFLLDSIGSFGVGKVIGEKSGRLLSLHEIAVRNQPGNNPPVLDDLHGVAVFHLPQEMGELPRDQSGGCLLHNA